MQALSQRMMPNGLEMSRPAISSILHQTRLAATGWVGFIELLGSTRTERGSASSRYSGNDEWDVSSVREILLSESLGQFFFLNSLEVDKQKDSESRYENDADDRGYRNAET